MKDTSTRVLMAKTEEHGSGRRRAWFLDSGCSNHMSGDHELLSNVDMEFKDYVKLSNNKRMEVKGKGKGSV